MSAASGTTLLLMAAALLGGCCCRSEAVAIAASAPVVDGDVLLFGPGVSVWSAPPPVALYGVDTPADGSAADPHGAGPAAAHAPGGAPYPVWENYAQIPRAIEPNVHIWRRMVVVVVVVVVSTGTVR
jgi:hypothetical protein